LRLIRIKVPAAVGKERGIKITGRYRTYERDGCEIMKGKRRMSGMKTIGIGNVNAKEPMVLRDVDVPRNPQAAEDCGPRVETDRANYNFPIKTSVGKNATSNEKKPPKKDSELER